MAISYFNVDDALAKHGVTRIVIDGTMCSITRSNGSPEIVFDITSTETKTITNFNKAANLVGVDSNLRSAIKFHFIIQYHNRKKEQDSKKSGIQLRKLEDSEHDIANKVGEARENERERRNNLQYEEVTVSECVRMHKGAVKIVGGSISGAHRIEKMIAGEILRCAECGSRYELLCDKRPRFSYEMDFMRRSGRCQSCEKGELYSIEDGEIQVNASRSELQETDSIHGLERLDIILLEECTNGVMAAGGKQVVAYGEIFVLNIKKRLIPVVFVYNIEYLEKEDATELSNTDIEEFEKLKGRSDIASLLGKEIALSVFGYSDIKEGILYSAATAGIDSAKFKTRLQMGLIGETGLAKTKLLLGACAIVPKSKFCSAPTSSVRSLIAIVDPNDTDMIHFGNIVLANGAMCAIDEVGRMSAEDQGLLLNAFQEGRIPFAKHGHNLELNGSATFIISSNPHNADGTFKDPKTVQMYEIPLIGPLRDRIDIIFIVRGDRTESSLEDFANKKLDQVSDTKRAKEVEDAGHTYVRKYLIFCKQYSPRMLTQDAKSVIIQYYKRVGGSRSPRMVETLHNIAAAIARLKQRETHIEEEDACQAIEFFNKQLATWDEINKIPADPRIWVRDQVLNQLYGQTCHYAFVELVRTVCKDDKYASSYIGHDFNVESNYRLRQVRDMFTESLPSKDLLVVRRKPLELAWGPTYIYGDRGAVSDTSDASDTSDDNKNVTEDNRPTDATDVTDATETGDPTEYERYQNEQRERFERELSQ